MLDETQSVGEGSVDALPSFHSRPARTRKVAILGFGRTVRDCPWRDPSWELWAMNGFWRAAAKDYGIDAPEERFSLWFDMHTVEFTRAYGKAAGFGDAQERWLERPHPFPVFMLDAAPEFPSVHRFPIESVIERLGRDYFTSTVAYALAFALAQPDVAEIGMWGIDLAHDSEYSSQRPCAEYWIGRAEAAGIRITTHADSAVLRQRERYGYDEANPLLHELRVWLGGQAHQLREGLERGRAELDEIHAQLHTDDGAMQALGAVLQADLADEQRAPFAAELARLQASHAAQQDRAEAVRGQLHTDDGALQTVTSVQERLEVWARGGRL